MLTSATCWHGTGGPPPAWAGPRSARTRGGHVPCSPACDWSAGAVVLCCDWSGARARAPAPARPRWRSRGSPCRSRRPSPGSHPPVPRQLHITSIVLVLSTFPCPPPSPLSPWRPRAGWGTSPAAAGRGSAGPWGRAPGTGGCGERLVSLDTGHAATTPSPEVARAEALHRARPRRPKPGRGRGRPVRGRGAAETGRHHQRLVGVAPGLARGRGWGRGRGRGWGRGGGVHAAVEPPQLPQLPPTPPRQPRLPAGLLAGAPPRPPPGHPHRGHKDRGQVTQGGHR